MKSNRWSLTLGSLLTLAFCAPLPAQTSPSATPASPTETVQLPTFAVSGERADPYRATDALSAARIQSAIIDTPATINVVTSDFIKDIGANSMLDATQYMPGISAGRIAGTKDFAS